MRWDFSKLAKRPLMAGTVQGGMIALVAGVLLLSGAVNTASASGPRWQQELDSCTLLVNEAKLPEKDLKRGKVVCQMAWNGTAGVRINKDSTSITFLSNRMQPKVLRRSPKSTTFTGTEHLSPSSKVSAKFNILKPPHGRYEVTHSFRMKGLEGEWISMVERYVYSVLMK